MIPEQLNHQEEEPTPGESQERSKSTGIWIFLIFAVVFGIFAWMIFENDDHLTQRMLAVLGVAAALLAIFIAPAELRSYAGPIGAALLLVSVTTLGWQLFAHIQSIDKTRETHFVQAQTAPGATAQDAATKEAVDLADGGTATISVPSSESSSHRTLQLTLRVVDAPGSRSVQDCNVGSVTSVDLAVDDGLVKVASGVPVSFQVAGKSATTGTITMRSGQHCVMQVKIEKAEYKLGDA